MTRATRRWVGAVLIVLAVLVAADAVVMFAVAFVLAALHGSVPAATMPTAVVTLTAVNVVVMMSAPRRLVLRWEIKDWAKQYRPDQAILRMPSHWELHDESDPDHRAP